MEEKVAEHKSTIDYNEPRDYIDKVQFFKILEKPVLRIYV
jgi:hypothetical protein